MAMLILKFMQMNNEETVSTTHKVSTVHYKYIVKIKHPKVKKSD